MIALFKNREGIIKFGNYAVAPSEATYNSVSEIPNNSYAVLTAEQVQRYESGLYNQIATYVIDGIVPIKSLEQLKAEKLNQLNTNYAVEIAKGFTYNETTIAKEEKDIDLFNKQLNGVRSLIDINQSPESVGLLDINSNYVTLSLSDYQLLMANYFIHNQNLYFSLGSKQAQINGALNETQLNEINIEF